MSNKSNNFDNQLDKFINKSILSLRKRKGVIEVFDKLRKKYVKLTPEEEVRQNFINYLINYLGYPPSLMANEIGIRLNGNLKRCDTVVFSKNGEPLVIIEYKSLEIKICQDTFDQIVRYNSVLKAPYLFITNGREQFCCHIDYDERKIKFLPSIPSYSELIELL